MPEQLDLSDEYEWMVKEFGVEKTKRIMYELQYYNLYGQLPGDAIYIEKVEWVNGSAIIVHQDPGSVKQ